MKNIHITRHKGVYMYQFLHKKDTILDYISIVYKYGIIFFHFRLEVEYFAFGIKYVDLALKYIGILSSFRLHEIFFVGFGSDIGMTKLVFRV